jgi:hypothetical protein
LVVDVSVTAREALLRGFLVPVGLGRETVRSGEGLWTLRCDLAPVEIK